MPVASVILFAVARPVGAHRRHRTFLANEYLEDRVYEGCLADAGSAGEHQHFGCERLFEGLLLAWGEVFACLLLTPCDGLFDVNGGKIRASGGQRLDARGHALLGALEFGQEDLDFAADLFQDEFAVLDRALGEAASTIVSATRSIF